MSDALASADKKIASLRDSVDIRRKAMANMREDIAELKGEVRESLEEIEAFNKAKTFQEAALDSLEKELEELKKISSPRVEDALPPSSEALGTVILKMSGLEPFGTIASELKEALPALSGIARNDKKFGEFISVLGTFGDFFGAVRDAAVLLEIDRRPELYVSFLADAAKFGEFVSRDSGLYSFEPWYEKGVGYYTLRPVGENSVEKVWFYVAVRPVGASSLVFMTTREDAISRMTDAYEGVSPRFETERRTSGENFFQVKLKDGLTYRDIGLSMWNAPALANLWNSTPDKVLWSVIEESWTREGGDIVGETYSDMFERNPEMLSPRPKNALKGDIYGDGSLAYYAAADFGLLLNMILPGATSLTPEILALADTYAAFPFFSKEDFTNLLRGGWLSLVCVEKDDRVSAAYALLETNIPSAANALYKLADMLFVTIPGSRADIAGWNSAMSAAIPLPWKDSQPAPSLVIAEKPGAFLVGLGNAEDFGKTLDVPAESLDYVNTENIGELFISPKLFDVAISYINYFADSKKSVMSPEDAKVKDLMIGSMAGARDSFALLGGGVRPTGRGYVRLALPEGKDPIKSLFADVFVPWLEFAAAGQNTAADSAEATRIINDLRNLKSAALLYYGDNLKWPAQDDVLELDKYLDRPIASGDRYERVIIGGEYDDASGNKKANIGVKLRPGSNSTPAILEKLAGRAADAGLLENADSLDSYGGSSLEVYMNMR